MIVRRIACLMLLVSLGSAHVVGQEIQGHPPIGPTPPNIVLILADDLGYGEIHALNPDRSKIPTPNIDKLVEQGMVFTDAHSASSVCTPTRYALLTGRYGWRTRLQKGVVTGNADPLIDEDRFTLPRMLQLNGYHTACIGKWHLNFNYEGDFEPRSGEDPRGAGYLPGPAPIGTKIPDGPLSRGFNYFFGFHHSREMSSLVVLNKVAEEIDVVDMLPRLVADAVEYVEGNAVAAKQGDPFFLYLPLSSPHWPIVPSEQWIGKSGMGKYADFVMQTDDAVGQVVRAIDDNGIADNTLVIFASDNGTSPQARIAELKTQGHYPSAHFRGAKADIWDGGHRIPFIVRWPAGGVKPGTTSDQLICLSDMMATVAEVVGEELPEDAGEDSFSFLPILSGKPLENPREAIVHHSGGGYFAIRKGRWKLNLARGSGGISSPTEQEAAEQDLAKFQLYDMVGDPSETRNLLTGYPHKTVELMDLLDDYVERGRSTPGPDQTNATDVEVIK